MDSGRASAREASLSTASDDAAPSDEREKWPPIREGRFWLAQVARVGGWMLYVLKVGSSSIKREGRKYDFISSGARCLLAGTVPTGAPQLHGTVFSAWHI